MTRRNTFKLPKKIRLALLAKCDAKLLAQEAGVSEKIVFQGLAGKTLRCNNYASMLGSYYAHVAPRDLSGWEPKTASDWSELAALIWRELSLHEHHTATGDAVKTVGISSYIWSNALYKRRELNARSKEEVLQAARHLGILEPLPEEPEPLPEEKPAKPLNGTSAAHEWSDFVGDEAAYATISLRQDLDRIFELLARLRNDVRIICRELGAEVNGA